MRICDIILLVNEKLNIERKSVIVRLIFDGQHKEIFIPIVEEIAKYSATPKMVNFLHLIDEWQLNQYIEELELATTEREKEDLTSKIQTVVCRGIRESINEFKKVGNKRDIDIFQVNSPISILSVKNMQPFAIYGILRQMEDMYLPNERFILNTNQVSDNLHQIYRLMERDNRRKYQVQFFSTESYADMKENIRIQSMRQDYLRNLVVLDMDNVLVNLHKFRISAKDIEKKGSDFFCQKYTEKGKFDKNLELLIERLRTEGFLPMETDFVILTSRDKRSDWDRTLVEYVGLELGKKLASLGWVSADYKVRLLMNTTYDFFGEGTFFKSYSINSIHQKMVKMYGKKCRMIFFDDTTKYVKACVNTVNLPVYTNVPFAISLDQEVSTKYFDLAGKRVDCLIVE